MKKVTITYPNGIKYVGEFKDDKRHGQGRYTFKNGDEYDEYIGEWKDGKMHGKGTYLHDDGTLLKGIFENDKFVEPD